MMSTIHDRITQICEYKCISLRQLANNAGVTYNSLYSSVQKKSDIGISTIAKISLAVPDISCKWLLHGSGNMIEKHTDNDNIIDGKRYTKEISQSWASFQNFAQKLIAGYIENIYAGKFAVAPKKSCSEYCQLKDICRLALVGEDQGGSENE